MKKIYIIPANSVYNAQSSAILAESGNPNSVGYAGSNKEGGPVNAETREESSFSTDGAWDNEW